MSEELKLCPFCGATDAKLFAYRTAEDSMEAFVECHSCGVGTDHFEDAYAPREQAITAWNTRTTDARITSLEEENARLREALDSIIDDCEADYPPSHGAIKHFARAALSNRGEG